MDYSVFRRKKPAPKKEDAPPPPPPPPVVEPEPMPVREEDGHRYMSDWGGFGESYMDMDRLFSNPRINNIDIANAQRVRIHFRDYYNYDQPDASYYDLRTLPFSIRHDHYPDHHHHDHYGHGHWPAALPPPRAATRYMLPPPPPPPHQRYYGHGYEHQYALPPPPAAYHPSYFY